MMCSTNATEFGSDWADFVTRAPDRSRLTLSHAATQHATRLECLISVRAGRQEKISNLVQKPRFRL
jgi:hypothetical protein